MNDDVSAQIDAPSASDEEGASKSALLSEIERARLMPEPEVRLMLGNVSKSTLWRMVRRGEFPRPVKISERRRGYRAGEVFDAIASRKPA